MNVPPNNPWLDLPDAPPFVAPVDAEVVDRCIGGLKDKCELRLDLRPQPWTGSVATAEVLVLALNPGFHPDDLLDVRNPDYAEQWRLALSFSTRTPFYFLDPVFRQTGGGRWWHKRVRELIEAAGFDAVSRGLMCVEHFPYKSTRYAALGETLPSQQYSLTIVREAIRSDKPIVIMRSEHIWRESVPELREYPYIRLSNHQNPYLNRAQMTNEQFERVVAAMRG